MTRIFLYALSLNLLISTLLSFAALHMDRSCSMNFSKHLSPPTKSNFNSSTESRMMAPSTMALCGERHGQDGEQ